MRMNGEADISRVATHLDRKRHLGDEVAGVGTDDARAQHAVRSRIEQQLRDAVVATSGE